MSDTGIGIPQERQERSSSRSSRPTARPRASTEAPDSAWRSRRSLWSCSADASGWRARSAKGSTFHFTVSFDLQQAPAEVTTATPDEQKARLRDTPVLIVDDSAVSRRLLETTLEPVAHGACAGRGWTGRSGGHAQRCKRGGNGLSSRSPLSALARASRLSHCRCNHHGVAALAEQPCRHQLVDLVVLGQENTQLGPGLAQLRLMSGHLRRTRARRRFAEDRQDRFEELGVADRLGERGRDAKRPAASSVSRCRPMSASSRRGPASAGSSGPLRPLRIRPSPAFARRGEREERPFPPACSLCMAATSGRSPPRPAQAS